MRRYWSQAHRDEAGQAIPLLLLAIMGLLATGMIFTQMGRITELRADAVTAADAAALAGADEVADSLEGVGGLEYIARRNVDGTTRFAARNAADHYAGLNDADLEKLSIQPVNRFKVAVRADTESRRTIGEPAASREMADTQGAAEATAVAELRFTAPPFRRGCAREDQITRAAEAIGIDPPQNTGLRYPCGGADVRNLLPEVHQAVLMVEARMNGEIVRFRRGYVTVGELLAQGTTGSPIVPGRSLLHWGLSFEVSTRVHAQAIDQELERMGALAPLCQLGSSRYFSHAQYDECGGPRSRPTPVFFGIEVDDPRLVDRDSL